MDKPDEVTDMGFVFRFWQRDAHGLFVRLVPKHDEIHVRVVGISTCELVRVGRIVIGYLWQVAWH